MAMASFFASTRDPNLPWTESYFRRWAKVCASVRSFTATTSNSFLFRPARRTFRPILPNPLIPTLTAIRISSFRKLKPLYNFFSFKASTFFKRRAEDFTRGGQFDIFRCTCCPKGKEGDETRQEYIRNRAGTSFFRG